MLGRVNSNLYIYVGIAQRATVAAFTEGAIAVAFCGLADTVGQGDHRALAVEVIVVMAVAGCHQGDGLVDAGQLHFHNRSGNAVAGAVVAVGDGRAVIVVDCNQATEIIINIVGASCPGGVDS